ncbi:chitinase domain-containing protein 1 [Aethina tumida]|uniref:chitinase domain-containing protein 1 n=1 Tax=Aethina tumida TaxID=116153 RepID=UPI0021478150|nr:chitinase domain-containing protein 1 [Aethina tumida]
MMYKTVIYFCIICICLNECTLSPKSPKTKQSKEVKPIKNVKIKTGPLNLTVFQRNLVVENPTPKEIVSNHGAFFQETDEYNFDGMVLGYVTPWNNHGYDVAKIFGNKFTHISPVWLQVVKSASMNYQITGTHDVDMKWMVDVKNAGRERKLKIIPRIIFEQWTGHDFQKIISEPEERKAVTATLIKEAKKYHFDGYVVEIWTQLVFRVRYEALIVFIRHFADDLTAEGLQMILVIPPVDGKNDLFSKKHFDALYDHITAFSLMTYDFSSPAKPGPNSPLSWVERCVKELTSDEKKRKKILTGLNMYGNDYSFEGSNSVVGHDYIKKLQTFGKYSIKYDSNADEHVFAYMDKDQQHVVYYPTLYSINNRIKLAKQMNTGLSLWEIGQGLDYFYDLL